MFGIVQNDGLYLNPELNPNIYNEIHPLTKSYQRHRQHSRPQSRIGHSASAQRKFNKPVDTG